MYKMTHLLQRIKTGFFIVCLFIVVSCTGCNNQTPESRLADMPLPEDTSVIIHASTFTASGAIELFPQSKIYYYNQNGEILAVANEPEEVGGEFIAESPENLCYFFKNHSTLSNQTTVSDMENTSGTKIDNIKFGPSQIGYLNEQDMFYSLINVGSMSTNTSYNYILRFVANDETYDVIIPYFLDSVCYDAIQKKFICIIAPVNLNDLDTSDALHYVTVNWDNSTGKFIYNNEVHHLPGEIPFAAENYFTTGYMAKNDCLYEVVVIPNNIEDIYGEGSMVLHVYDLKNNSFHSSNILIDEYELGVYGGNLAGSGSLPATESNGKLYVFAASKQVIVIQDADNIEILDMPYVFENIQDLSYSNYYDFTAPQSFPNREDFTDSIVCVEDDGQIYILSLFKDKYFRIHKLLNDGTYELFWEGKLMEDLRKDMLINSFEIISYKDDLDLLPVS